MDVDAPPPQAPTVTAAAKAAQTIGHFIGNPLNGNEKRPDAVRLRSANARYCARTPTGMLCQLPAKLLVVKRLFHCEQSRGRFS